jgi:hypothetical protein
VYAALAVYCITAGLLIVQNPGVQYDEALTVVGSVHMAGSRDELSLPHDPGTWLTVSGRSIPLMTLRYSGAIKEYLYLPLYLIFGPSVELLRVTSMLLGLLGIWGIATLIYERVSQPAAFVAAFLLAINPAYVNQTVFDQGVIATWMAAFGLLCLALTRYPGRMDAQRAFEVGIAVGFGVWARANFLWLLIAMFAAAVVLLGRKLFARPAHWLTGSVGAILGGAPFLVYQVLSKGGTWEALGMFPANEPFGDRIINRAVLFAEVLLSDREHRAMWDGPPMPAWQQWLFPAIVLTSSFMALVGGRRYWPRFLSLTFLILASTLFLTRLAVSEHHLIVLVPLSAALAAITWHDISARGRLGRIAATGLLLIYLASALHWHGAALRGLRATGGVGVWSDAMFALARLIETDYADRQITILDWGLQNSLYFLTSGKLHSREIFSTSSEHQDGVHNPWVAVIRNGGVFLLNGPSHRQFPVTSAEFLRALEDVRPSARRLTARERSGRVYAELIDIEPTSRQTAPDDEYSGVSLSTGDPEVADQLEGFYGIEANGWRWTKRKFSLAIAAPNLEGLTAARLMLELYVPAEVEKAGPITLRAWLSGRVIGRASYRRSGKHIFQCEVAPAWLKPGLNRFEFDLDKALPATPADRRELGLVVVRAALEPK